MDVLYDRIGSGYDFTRKSDPYLLNRLSDLLGPEAAGRYVDVACGSGNYSLSLAAAGLRITGFDVSAEMIATAKAKTAQPTHEGWLVADVSDTPFETGAFVGATCTLAIHHFPDLPAAFREVGRIVAADDGRFIIFTSTPEQMEHYWLNHYFPDMLRRSAQQMPNLDAVRRALGAAGFPRVATEVYSTSPRLEDLFLYSGKHRPSLYLDAGFRAGISSFANLAEPEEVERGLVKLARDVETGAIDDIIRSAEHENGDYLFICASR
jgi:ubiquinone/menaquinone biosynthesis C-methylase UbiE